MLLTIDDLISEKTFAKELDMFPHNVRRLRKENARKYELMAIGLYFQNEELELLVTTIDSIRRMRDKMAIVDLHKSLNAMKSDML